MSALRTVGVPYTDADIAGAQAAVAGKAEIEAVVAYLQQLGLLIPANADVLPVEDNVSPIVENPAEK
jgi:cbb3-type cytochrome oxidase cytochrome c subunit